MSGRLPRVALLGLALAGAGCDRRRPLPPGTWVALAGAADLAVGPAGEATPLFALGESRATLCLTPPGTADTRQWRLRSRPSAPPRPASTRLGTTVCFDLEPPEGPDGEGATKVCAEIVDDYDGARFRVPCQTQGWRDLASELAPWRARFAALLAREPTEPWSRLRREMVELAASAERAGLPMLAANLRLAVVHKDRRLASGEDLGPAAAMVDRPPAWLGAPAASAVAATWSYERGLLELARHGRTARGWDALREAEAAFARVGDGRRSTVVLERAVWLGELGDLESAQRLVREALAQSAAPASTTVLPWSARVDLAWLMLLDPDADTATLEHAESALLAALEGESLRSDALEQANARMNLALVRLRRGGAWEPALREARALLAGNRARGARGQSLLGWSRLIEGLAALRRGEPRRAVELCARLAAAAEGVGLRAEAWSCRARAERALGERGRARRSFEAALRLREAEGRHTLRRRGLVGPSARAETFFEAARLAVELGEPALAWTLLERLDALALRERAPAAAGGDPVPRAQPDYRAFAVEDEILLLERAPGAGARLLRRTPIARASVRAVVEALSGAPAAGEPRWRESLAPLARALWPGAGRGEGEPVVYGLHGWLQGVPLAALPASLERAASPAGAALPSGTGAAGPVRWLADLATVALRPAGAGAGLAQDPAEAALAAPLFVVDPDGSLPLAARAAEQWRAWFPGARILAGARATRPAVEAALAAAALLHVDAHGEYDPAFPERSALVLADARWRPGVEGASRRTRWLVNLSGCRTGRWPITADSGAYGLAGAFLAGGARWAIGSRDDLDDGLAVRFNRRLYEALGRGVALPAAYARAHAEIRRAYPVERWAGLILLSHGSDGPGGGDSSRR